MTDKPAPPPNAVLLKEQFEKAVPEDDNRERLVCRDCGFINYQNPKIVVGSVVTFEDRLLLCRRAIEPRHGYWTLPAGFLEEHETVEHGAAREAREEACADIVIESLLAVYSITHISQVQIMFKARLDEPEFGVGPESLEVKLFGWDEIPWDELAFPSVDWALNQYESVKGQAAYPPFTNPVLDEGRWTMKRG